jgi:signal peptidase I
MDPTNPPPAPDEPPKPTPEAPSAKPQPQHPRHIRHPLRLLFVVSGGLLALFLVLRTIALEPFGVPTGSMAPALIGHHRDGLCPRCGYTVRVGRPGAGGAAEHFANVTCPNCEHRFSLAAARDLSGDRLLVDKNVYELRPPRRWEMIVFRCPDPDPKEFGKPYVKRLVGLPGESITVADGDVYVNGEIARKGLAELRETVVPVFDMAFAPNPGGWGVRWLVEPVGSDPRLPAAAPNGPAPADGAVIQGNALVLDASDTPQTMTGATYRHWHLDEREEQPVRAWSAYDGTPRRRDRLPAAHDFVLTCEVEVTAAAGGGEACFAVRLMDGSDAVTAEITAGPRDTGRAQLTREKHGGIGSTRGVSLKPGRTYRLEFAFVDRRVLLALDGRLVLPAADLEPAENRREVKRPLQLGARGCRVVLRDLKLWRDVHYTQYGEHGVRHAVWLGPGEYFVLGDNSGNSQDSRKWPKPGVPRADLIGKPFLIHQPLRAAHVSVGGRERVFQTLDWSRLRWIH